MSLHDLMHQPETEKVGWAALIATWLMGIWNWITEHGNETIVVISGILGIIFLVLKIKLTYKEYRIKTKELDKLEKYDTENEK